MMDEETISNEISETESVFKKKMKDILVTADRNIREELESLKHETFTPYTFEQKMLRYEGMIENMDTAIQGAYDQFSKKMKEVSQYVNHTDTKRGIAEGRYNDNFWYTKVYTNMKSAMEDIFIMIAYATHMIMFYKEIYKHAKTLISQVKTLGLESEMGNRMTEFMNKWQELEFKKMEKEREEKIAERQAWREDFKELLKVVVSTIKQPQQSTETRSPQEHIKNNEPKNVAQPEDSLSEEEKKRLQELRTVSEIEKEVKNVEKRSKRGRPPKEEI